MCLLLRQQRGSIWFEVCVIIDYGFICAAFDEAVKQDPNLATQHWEATRRRLVGVIEYSA